MQHISNVYYLIEYVIMHKIFKSEYIIWFHIKFENKTLYLIKLLL